MEKLFRLCRTNRRGAAVVEFAIVAPVFFLLVFGMLEYGRLVMVQQVLTNASREGARQGILENSSVATVTSAVNNYLSSARVTGATVAVTPNPLVSGGSVDSVSVEVSLPFSQVSWLPSPMFLGGTTMRAVTVMRRENSN